MLTVASVSKAVHLFETGIQNPEGLIFTPLSP